MTCTINLRCRDHRNFSNDQISHQILKNKISAEVKQISDEYYCVIEIDHAFV